MASHAPYPSGSPSQDIISDCCTGENSLDLHNMRSNITMASRINANILNSSAIICNAMKTSMIISDTLKSNALDFNNMKASTMDVCTTASATMSLVQVANGNQNAGSEGSNKANIHCEASEAVLASPGCIEPSSSPNTVDIGRVSEAKHAAFIQALPGVQTGSNNPQSRPVPIFRRRLLDSYAAGLRYWTRYQMKAVFNRVPPYYRSVVLDGARAVPISIDRTRNTQAKAITGDPSSQSIGSHSQCNDRSRQQLPYESLEAELLGSFNNRFRNLPSEIREMILGFAITWDGKRSPNLIIAFRSDKNLYGEALKVFANNQTFVFDRNKIEIMDKSLPQFMPCRIWQSIRSLRIDHEYMIKSKNGRYRRFLHEGTNFESRYTPCMMCDFQLIGLASEVRSLHLDFGKCWHCKLPSMVELCRFAVRNMTKLERLVLELSNIYCRHTAAGSYDNAIARVNVSLDIKAKMLGVGTKFKSPSAHHANLASDSFFWQAEKGGTLTWVDQNIEMVEQSM